jgi:hypothetical protein
VGFYVGGNAAAPFPFFVVPLLREQAGWPEWAGVWGLPVVYSAEVIICFRRSVVEPGVAGWCGGYEGRMLTVVSILNYFTPGQQFL